MKIKLNPWTLPLAIIILVCLSVYSGFYMATSTAFPQNPGTYSYFNAICEMPNQDTYGPHPETFWEQGGDCDDRARVFANYLKSKGATNVQICWMTTLSENGTMITASDGGLGHEFVIWDDKVYNPSNGVEGRFYNASLKDFLSFMKNLMGYNTFYYENQTQGIPF
jgi:disulfide bond formation protein DsbB